MRTLLLSFLVLASAARTFGSDTITLRWSDLPQALAEQRVSVTSHAGKTWKGTVVGGDNAGLRLRMSKNEQIIARGDIASLRIRRERYKGRGIGLSVAALLSMGTIVADGSAGARAGAVALFMAIGYAFGHWADSGAGTDVIITTQ